MSDGFEYFLITFEDPAVVLLFLVIFVEFQYFSSFGVFFKQSPILLMSFDDFGEIL